MASSPTSPPKHILAIPFPIHGHISPMLQLSNTILLSSSTTTITFLSTLRNHANVNQSITSFQPHHLPRIRHLSLPDELPLDFQIVDMHSIRQLLHAYENLEHPFEQLIHKLCQENDAAFPPFSCILSDVHLGWTQDLAHKFGLPRVAFWTSNVSELAVYLQAPTLHSTGFLPFKDENGLCEVPGLPPLHRKFFPSFLQIQDTSDILFTYFIDQTKRVPQADCLLVNTVYYLEAAAIEGLRNKVPSILPIGPLAFLDCEDGGSLDIQVSAGFSTEADKCMTWLDKQKASSVLYVSFGSLAFLSAAQILELALGLEASSLPFLWVVRPGLVQGNGDALPPDYVNRVGDRALLVAWAPQLRVLSHPAVGGFLTHCGWNSTLESMYMGVPMLCWPVGADQPLTSKLVADVWGLGLNVEAEADGLVQAEEVGRGVAILLSGERGEEMRKRGRRMRDEVKKAVRKGGSSYENLDHVMRIWFA